MSDTTLASAYRQSRIVVHPLLIAFLFPLYLLAANADQWADLSSVWPPIVASVVLGGALFAGCALLFGGWQRGGLVASLLLVLFFTFGHTRFALRHADIGTGQLAVAWLGLAFAGFTFIGRGTRWHPTATRLLNVVALLLVAFNLVSFGTYLVGESTHTIGQTDATLPVGMVDETPDIYYLVFDRYASADTLEASYGYDNSAFLADLEARGFAVARDSWANYGGTALSLVSSLSLDYLDGEALSGGRPATYGPIHAALRGHLAVPQTLTSIGYRYIHIGNWWEPSTTNVDADEVHILRHESEFGTALLETSALTLVAGLGTRTDDPEVSEIGVGNRAHTLYEFGQVEAAAARPGPTYVFAHFLVPHPPYVFRADGSAPSAEEALALPAREAYIEQLRWTSETILELVDTLLDVPSGEEPIIILQADEGPYPPRYEANQDGFPWLEATPAEIQEKFGILNAAYLPGHTAAELAKLGVDERISPVNTFRVVFNAYFGTELPLLQDRTYLSPDKYRLYEFSLYDRPI